MDSLSNYRMYKNRVINTFLNLERTLMAIMLKIQSNFLKYV